MILAPDSGLGDAFVGVLAQALYWAMPVAVVLWSIAAVRRFRARRTPVGQFARRHAAGIAMATLVTAVAFVADPPALRMQFDETSLAATAQSMHTHRTAMMGTAALPAPGGGLALQGWNLDKRPPLFPFLVSVVHDLTGSRVQNAFVVNGACLWLLLVLLAVAARDRAGAWAGVAAPALAAAVPLVAYAGTSGGFELLATLLLTAVVLAALASVAESTPVRLQWLFANGILFASARYESLFVLLLVLALVAWRVRRTRVGRFGAVLLIAGPIVLLPVVLLLVHARDPGFYPEAQGRALVSLGNAATNLPPLATALFGIGVESAFPGPLAIAAALAFALRSGRRRAGFADLLVLAPVVATTAIACLWFYGDVREPTAQRLYLPIAVLLAQGVLLWGVPRGDGASGRWRSVIVLVAAIALAAPRLLWLHEGRILPQHRTAAVLDVVDQVLATVPDQGRPTVFVTTIAQYLIVRGVAAVPPVAFPVLPSRGRCAVLVLTTPLDAQLPQFGDPDALRQAQRGVELGRAGDTMVLYRLPD